MGTKKTARKAAEEFDATPVRGEQVARTVSAGTD